MSKIVIKPKHLEQLAALDDSIRALNEQKIKLLFKLLSLELSASDLEKILEWELILVVVPDKQMAVQLNKLSAYVPNLKFVVRSDTPLFTLLQGDKRRRVWKER